MKSPLSRSYEISPGRRRGEVSSSGVQSQQQSFELGGTPRRRRALPASPSCAYLSRS